MTREEVVQTLKAFCTLYREDDVIPYLEGDLISKNSILSYEAIIGASRDLSNGDGRIVSPTYMAL